MAAQDEKYINRHECEEVKKTVFKALDEIKGSLVKLDEAIRIRNNDDAKKEGYQEGVAASQGGKDKAMARKLKLYVGAAAIVSPIVLQIINAISKAIQK